MSTTIFDKFDEMVDVEGLKEDMKEAAENKMEFKEVPEGKYEVEINKMELKASKSGRPMLSVWMKILEGQYKGQLIFYNQVVDIGFGLHNANEFLKSLDSGLDIEFENYNQYGNLIMDIHEEISGNLEYGLKYGKNKKGYNTYEITDVFEN
ncbi:DUF669 domain-containing protein [Tissierellaceae bacterium HCP3S3_D8]